MKLFQAVPFVLVISQGAFIQGQSDPAPFAETRRARTISAELLKQPLSRKAKQILGKAQLAADAGDHMHAIALLETARAKYPESAAWTQSMLGVEYLKTRQFAAAVISLEQAVAMLPRDAVDRSNLGFALASTGEYDRAERELRCAIVLDRADLKTKQLLDVVIAARLPNQARNHN
jgi:Flp pilus assembly protein TadD